MFHEDTTKSKLANHEVKGMTLNSFASSALQQSRRLKDNSDDERSAITLDFHDIGSNCLESSNTISNSSNLFRRTKLLISVLTRNCTHKSNRASIRQRNRIVEKCTSAALFVAWVFLISSLLTTFQLFACGAGAGNENDKTHGNVTILEYEDGTQFYPFNIKQFDL